MGGVAVHAMAGSRDSYKPVRSWLHPTPDAAPLAEAFEAAYGFRELYLADLDAIRGLAPLNLHLIGEISGMTSLNLMVDGGFRSLEEAEQAFRAGASKIVLGTETLPALSMVGKALERFSPERVVVSLDLLGGSLLGPVELKTLKPWEAAAKLGRLGVQEVICLELSRVGMESGVDLEPAQRVLESFKGRVLVGGGVRGLSDLERLERAGFSGALVATCLHKRRIRPEELRERFTQV